MIYLYGCEGVARCGELQRITLPRIPVNKPRMWLAARMQLWYATKITHLRDVRLLLEV